ncbi:MAG TPA: hypothetical protein VGP47_03120 [Parachlamydiaceae bacterium]|nr:hypothetical protein [Parachlamydiaceae bacterium]
MISISCDFNIAPKFDIYDNPVPEGLKELLLKHALVNSSAEFDVLYRSMVTKESDFDSDWIIFCFAVKFSKIFREESGNLKQEELNTLFEKMLDLFSWCSENNLSQFSVEINKCFESISSYHNNIKKNPVQLPLEIHLKAFEITRNLLLKNIKTHDELQYYNIKTLLDTLVHIINHRDCTVGIQMALVNLIQSVSIDHKLPISLKIRTLSSCSTLEHASPDFHSLIVEKLLLYSDRKSESIENRMLSMEKMPFDPNFLNVSDKSRVQVIGFLNTLMWNHTEDIKLRKNAAKKLTKWVWSYSKFQEELGNKQKFTIQELIQLIYATKNKDTIDMVASDVAIDLFSELRKVDHFNPVGKCLFKNFKKLINDDNIPFEIKLNLTRSMPQGDEVLSLENPYGIDLFFLMLDKLSDENHSIELKKIYIHNLISCYLSPISCKAIGERDKAIASIDDFMKLDLFKTDLLLGLISINTYNKLFEQPILESSYLRFI